MSGALRPPATVTLLAKTVGIEQTFEPPDVTMPLLWTAVAVVLREKKPALLLIGSLLWMYLLWMYLLWMYLLYLQLASNI
jgi:hypothetical protein